jgi:hypothetical protein
VGSSGFSFHRPSVGASKYKIHLGSCLFEHVFEMATVGARAAIGTGSSDVNTTDAIPAAIRPSTHCPLIYYWSPFECLGRVAWWYFDLIRLGRNLQRLLKIR